MVVRPLIGVCEDDDSLRELLVRNLEREGFAVVATAEAGQALELFSDRVPAAIVLDIGLPDADGRDVCQALRAGGVTAPILFLTGLESLTDRLSGFHAGGDDYLTKPFAFAELAVRVHALLRRAGLEPDAGEDAPDDLRLDPAAMRASHGARSVSLTPTEFRLLGTLVGRRGEVVRRRALTRAGWPEGAIVHDNTLDTYLARLRRKLAELEAKTAIRTVRGVGYELR